MVEVFGNPMRSEVLRYIALNPGTHFGDMLEGIPELGSAPLVRHLRALELLGVVTLDLPPEKRRGRAPRYYLDVERVADLTATWARYVSNPEGAQ